MKRWIKNAALVFAAAASMSSLVSCKIDVDEDNYDTLFPNALVTVKPLGSNGDDFVLWVDDKTTLWPENITKRPFGDKEIRALTNVTIKDDKTDAGYKVAKVNWIDSILTSNTVPSTGSLAEDRKTYGNDPVEIIADWMTVMEDGYATFHFRTMWGVNSTVKHRICLVSGSNPDNPYEFILCHDAKGDASEWADDGLVAFRLSELDFQGRGGEQIDITIRWKSFAGEKSQVFKYTIRDDWAMRDASKM